MYWLVSPEPRPTCGRPKGSGQGQCNSRSGDQSHPLRRNGECSMYELVRCALASQCIYIPSRGSPPCSLPAQPGSGPRTMPLQSDTLAVPCQPSRMFQVSSCDLAESTRSTCNQMPLISEGGCSATLMPAIRALRPGRESIHCCSTRISSDAVGKEPLPRQRLVTAAAARLDGFPRCKCMVRSIAPTRPM